MTVTSWCTQPGPNNSWFVEWILKPLFLNGVIKNMAVMERMLEDSDPRMLNYTIVRPCRLLLGMYTQKQSNSELIKHKLFFCSANDIKLTLICLKLIANTEYSDTKEYITFSMQ